MFRYWRGPVQGKTVGRGWNGYGIALFLEFEPLHTKEFRWKLRDKVSTYREGEWTITTMESYPLWSISRASVVLATSASRRRFRDRALELLNGRELKSVQLDRDTQATRLKFSSGLILETEPSAGPLRRQPHWLLRGPDTGPDHWPAIE